MRRQNKEKMLAMHGGSKCRIKPFPGRGLIGREEKAAVNALFDRAIASGEAFGYNGEQEEAYCREFARFMGGGYADAVNSGITALYVVQASLIGGHYRWQTGQMWELRCPIVNRRMGVWQRGHGWPVRPYAFRYRWCRPGRPLRLAK